MRSKKKAEALGKDLLKKMKTKGWKLYVKYAKYGGWYCYIKNGILEVFKWGLEDDDSEPSRYHLELRVKKSLVYLDAWCVASICEDPNTLVEEQATMFNEGLKMLGNVAASINSLVGVGK